MSSPSSDNLAANNLAPDNLVTQQLRASGRRLGAVAVFSGVINVLMLLGRSTCCRSTIVSCRAATWRHFWASRRWCWRPIFFRLISTQRAQGCCRELRRFLTSAWTANLFGNRDAAATWGQGDHCAAAAAGSRSDTDVYVRRQSPSLSRHAMDPDIFNRAFYF